MPLPAGSYLECSSIAAGMTILDGKTIGPFTLQPSGTAGRPSDYAKGPLVVWPLADLHVAPVPPEGYTFRVRHPSPFVERINELGGCELQRLISCPVAVGYLGRT